ncbi:MAG TPA: ABC transporter permease subunit [Acidimicrobiia bacterium]|nr:ABC transporter permease subunit [Acidimicrobiia bacterium]
MLTNVFTKSLRDRSTAFLIGALSIGVMLWFGMAVYRDVDIGFYYENLPPAILEMMGIPQTGDVAGIAFGAMYNLIGAFTLAGLAISMGAYAIAGEERDGTLGLLLGNPLSRTGVLVAKAASLVALTALGTLILWGFGLVVPEWLDIDMSGIDVTAVMLALFFNALVYGCLALGIATWTGNRSLGSGVAVAVMLVGYLGASLLPLTENLADWARIFPWYYFTAGNPVVNGTDWGHIAVMGGLAAAFFVGAFSGVIRRDLKEMSTDRTVFDRLRESPRTRKMMERISGSARVSRISVKTASEFQGLLVITGSIMFYLGLLMPIFYGLIPDEFIELVESFPDALIAMVGGANMATAAGYLQAEIFSITGPIAILVVTIVMGAKALAGEEEGNTMGFLLGNPITRAHLIVEKTIAMVVYAVAVGMATFLGTWVGTLLAGTEVTATGLAGTSALMTLMGLLFGGLALAVGAATGRSRLASWVATGVALVSYFVFSFFPISEAFEPWARLSPFDLYLGSDPLTNGMAWGDAAILAAIFLVLVAISVPLFQRRDLRG